MKKIVGIGLIVTLLATVLFSAVPASVTQAQDSPDIKPRVFLPAVSGAAAREFTKIPDADLLKAWGITGQILPVNTGEFQAATATTVNALSLYGSVLTIAGTQFYDLVYELQNPDSYTCATSITVSIRVQKSDGTYYYTTSGSYLPYLMPGKKSPGGIRRSFAEIGGTPTGASITGITAEDCATAVPDSTIRSIPVTGYATSVYSPNPMDGTQYTGVVTNTTGYRAAVTVVATSYLTGTFTGVAAFAGLAQISVVDQVLLDPGQSYTWTDTRPGGTGGPKYGGYPVAFEAVAWDDDYTPNIWWDWSSGTTAKRTAGYNPGGSASTGQISLMSAYGDKISNIYTSNGGAYYISALIRNNNLYAGACYVNFNVRIYHNDNTYQTFTGVGGLSTEGLAPNSIMPAAIIILGDQITGGLSNTSGYAITGGKATECEPGLSFGALATSGTSKTVQGNGDVWYAGTVTNNTAKPTGNLTGSFAVLNSNGSIRYAGSLTPEGEGEQAGMLDAWASKTFAGAAALHISPSLQTMNTSYYLQASWYSLPGGVAPQGVSPYAWSVPTPNGITVVSSWGGLYQNNGLQAYVTALVRNNSNLYACDITLNALMILDDGYYTVWPIPSTYTGHSLLKCIPPGATTAINTVLPKNQTPNLCCLEHRIVGGTFTPSTGPVVTFAPTNTAKTIVSSGGYYTATITNNTAYTYTQVSANVDIYNGGAYSSYIRYGLPLTSTDTLFTPGEAIQVTGRSYIIGVGSSNPATFRAVAQP